MATDKKHIAVYLDPAVEQALIAFCEQKGMVSKKGFMYSAGVNAVLAEFFGVSSAEPGNIPTQASNIPTIGNIPTQASNIPTQASNIPTQASNIPTIGNIPTQASNILIEHTQIEGLPGKFKA